MNNVNLNKGDWRKVATTKSLDFLRNPIVHTLWNVTLKNGESHEVVTARIFLGDEIIEEVDGAACMSD